MNKNKKIEFGVFQNNDYSVLSQKVHEDEHSIKFAGFHVVSKYVEVGSNYEFIQLASNNKFCLVVFTISKSLFYYNDGINPDDCNQWILYTFDQNEDLYNICNSLGLDANDFDVPWKCNYPFS